MIHFTFGWEFAQGWMEKNELKSTHLLQNFYKKKPLKRIIGLSGFQYVKKFEFPEISQSIS